MILRVLNNLSTWFFKIIIIMYLSNDIPNKLAGDVTQRPKDIKIQSPHVVLRIQYVLRAANIGGT